MNGYQEMKAQSSKRTLLIVCAIILIAGCALSAILGKGYMQHRAIAAIRSHGGSVGYKSNVIARWAPTVVLDYWGTVNMVGLNGRTVTGHDVFQLKALTNVEQVNFINASVNSEALDALSSLSSVNEILLYDAEFDQEQLKQVMHSLKLTRLGLDGTKIDDRFFQSIVQVCPTLERIDLGKTAVTDETCRFLSELPKLRILVLSDTTITDKGLLSLAKAPSLRIVYADGTNISSEAIARLHATRPDIDVQTQIR